MILKTTLIKIKRVTLCNDVMIIMVYTCKYNGPEANLLFFFCFLLVLKWKLKCYRDKKKTNNKELQDEIKRS